MIQESQFIFDALLIFDREGMHAYAVKNFEDDSEFFFVESLELNEKQNWH